MEAMVLPYRFLLMVLGRASDSCSRKWKLKSNIIHPGLQAGADGVEEGVSSVLSPQTTQPGVVYTVEQQEQFDQQTLTEHLAELRSCLLISLGAVAVGFAAAYSVVRHLADWFLRPLIQVLPEGRSLIFTSYQEGFFFT
jgi:sec-independent protein translocase protein TatC